MLVGRSVLAKKRALYAFSFSFLLRRGQRLPAAPVLCFIVCYHEKNQHVVHIGKYFVSFAHYIYSMFIYLVDGQIVLLSDSHRACQGSAFLHLYFRSEPIQILALP